MNNYTRLFISFAGMTMILCGLLLVFRAPLATWQITGGCWLLAMGVACEVVFMFGDRQ